MNLAAIIIITFIVIVFEQEAPLAITVGILGEILRQNYH